MFGAALDPAGVTLRRAKWFMLQPVWTTMAPDGHVWFHPNGDAWSEDFAAEGLAARAHLIHELTHVWQRQQGLNLVLRRPPFARYAYLPLVPGKPFARYGIEQQARIVEHAYVLREGGRVPGAPPLEAYRALWPLMA